MTESNAIAYGKRLEHFFHYRGQHQIEDQVDAIFISIVFYTMISRRIKNTTRFLLESNKACHQRTL